jgi:hypothetical protein
MTMPTNRKPRKSYDPNRRLERCAAIMERTVARMPIRKDAARDIEIAAHIALDRLLKGGDKDSLYVLASAIDVAHELAKDPVRGVGADYLAEIEAGMAAIVRAKKHGDLTGTWKLAGDDAEWVSTALAVHDAQLELASRALVIETIKTVTERVEGGSKETEFEEMMLEAA